MPSETPEEIELWDDLWVNVTPYTPSDLHYIRADVVEQRIAEAVKVATRSVAWHESDAGPEEDQTCKS